MTPSDRALFLELSRFLTRPLGSIPIPPWMRLEADALAMKIEKAVAEADTEARLIANGDHP